MYIVDIGKNMKKNFYRIFAGLSLILVFTGNAKADYLGNATSFEDVDRGIGVESLATTFTNDGYTTVIKQSITLPVASAKLDYIFFFGFRDEFPEMSINGVKFFESDYGVIGGDGTVFGFNLNSFQVGSQLDILFYGSSTYGRGAGVVGLAKNDGSFSPSIARSGYVDLDGPHYTEVEGLPILFGLNYTPVVAVPEVGSLGMLMAGLGLIGFIQRRKKLNS
jgi:hypothetical protein